MNITLRYLIISISVATLIAAGNIVPRGYAQSSSTPTAKSICPLGSSPVGLICHRPPPAYNLPIGKWSIYVNGFIGILNISSVDSMGKVQGTMYGAGGNSSVSNVTLLCIVAHPCTIDGSFDGQTGKLSFKSTPTIDFVPSFQNYTGYLSQVLSGIDLKIYTLAGIGRSFTIHPGAEFGWYATKTCLVMGCVE
jgi:hypothetical protein